MEDVLVDGFSLTLVDYEGQALPQGAVSAAALVYGYWTYDTSSMTGKPTSYPSEFSTDMAWASSYNSTYGLMTMSQSSIYPAMAADGTQTGGSTWTFDALNFRVAGKYYGAVDFTVDGMNFLMTSITDAAGSAYLPGNGLGFASAAENVVVEGNALAHNVVRTWTTLPELEITGVTPEAGEEFNMNYVYNKTSLVNLQRTWNYIESEYSAYVSIKAEEDEDGAITYTLPEVAMQITGTDKIDSVELYNSGRGATGRSFDGTEGTVSAGGSLNDGASPTTTSYTFSYLNVSYDGMVCLVTLANPVTVTNKNAPARSLYYEAPTLETTTSSALDAATVEAITAAMEEAGLLDYRAENPSKDEDGTVLSPYAVLTYDKYALEFTVEDVEDSDEKNWTVSSSNVEETYSNIACRVLMQETGETNDDGETLYEWGFDMYTLDRTITTDYVTKEVGTATYEMEQWYTRYMSLSSSLGVTWTSRGYLELTTVTGTIAETAAYYVNKITPYLWTQSDFTANTGENETAETVSYERVVDAKVYATNYSYEEAPFKVSGDDYWDNTLYYNGRYVLVVEGVSAEDIEKYLLETYGLVYTTATLSKTTTTWTLDE
ncbi:MAG: hypothetical protein LUD69_00210 [Oscillospiraceae bacterium]|nr:hypothetical protein [Oscillospiraceae bacterium]